MKIYRYVRLDINGNTLEEESFIYNGEITECKGGSSVPPPTEAETELTETQTELLEQQIEQITLQNEMLTELWPSLEQYYTDQIEYAQLQMDAATALLPLQTELAEQGVELQGLQLDAIKDEIGRHEALEPVLLEAMGYEKDESGNYVAIEGEQDPLLAQLEERYTGAMEGKAETSPYLESQLTKERAKLEEDLSRRLGKNWQSSTPGIQALSEFDTRADLLRTEAQQRAVSSAGSQYLSARGLLAGEKQQNISNISALMGGGTGVTNVPTGMGGGGMPQGLMGGGGSASVGISDLRNYYQNQRYSQWASQEGRRAGRQQAMMGGMVAGAGAGMTYGAMAGTAMGPGYGTAIGAGVGLLAGYLLS